jgi:hypothetical protein
MSITDFDKIRDLIYKYFQMAKSKEMEYLPDFFGNRFTKFGDSPPYELRDIDRALILEQLQFASISDYDFKIVNLKIEIILDEVAIATFMLETTGIVVDDYSFRGTAVNNKVRATIVLQKDKKDKSNGWKMLHQHFSTISG